MIDFYKSENSIKDYILRHKDYIFITIILIVALVIRYSFLEYISGDMKVFILNWIAVFENAGFDAFKNSFSNYNSPYLYALYFVSIFFSGTILSKVISVKLISIIFDLLIVFIIYKILKHNKINKQSLYLAISVSLLLPTIILNSSVWGQCDSIYCFFCLLSLYYLQKDKYTKSLLSYSFGFIFKLQTIFLFPFLFFWWLKQKNLRFAHFLIIPLVFFLTDAPAWLLSDAEFTTIYSTYADLPQYYNSVFLSVPTFYVFLDSKIMIKPAILLTIGIISILIYLKLNQKKSSQLFETALLFTLTTIYFLPKMHERYFYLTEVLALIYVFLKPSIKSIFIVVWLQLSSCLTYSYVLFGNKLPIFVYQILSFGFILAIGILVYENIYKPQKINAEMG